jgi:hypothetical protein
MTIARRGEMKMKLELMSPARASTVRTRRAAKLLVVLPMLTVLLSSQTGAFAYNNREHERWPDQAYQVLNVINRGAYVTERVRNQAAKTTPPSPVPLLFTQRPAAVPASEQALWDRFIAEARLAAPKLDQLLVDLPDPNRRSDECGHAYPELATGRHLAACRAGELSFAPRRGWNSDPALCYLRRGYQLGDSDSPEFFADVPGRDTGALLGFYSQAVDDEVKDTIMTVRLTNLGFAGAVKGFAEKATELGLTILLAPFVCVAEFLFGGSDCLDDAANAAHDADVIARIDEVIPDGIGQIDGDDLFSTTGLWHFLNIGHSGEFNHLPGMSYLDGGVNGVIDATDLLIVAGADLGGLTLDPDSSLGVSRYGQFADGPKSRRRSDYWSVTIGHVEFEPLDNLALFGWQRFTTSKGASGLGWVLHALGDALAPQHVIAATGWGHRPYEDFAGFVWPQIFHEGTFNHHYDLSAALVHAYRWWRFIDDRQGGNSAVEVPVRELIEAIGTETRSLPTAAATLLPVVSLPYLIDGDPGLAKFFYTGQEPNVYDLATRSMGATIAFLVKAAAFLQPVPATPGNDPCLCPTGQARVGVGVAGQIFRSGTCLACGQGAFATTPDWLDGECVASCPADKPLVENASCVATCSTTSCTGVSCPAGQPFVDNGQCAAHCSAANAVIVNHRECTTSCPAGQTPDDGGFCTTQAHPGVLPVCVQQSTDSTGVCCVPRAGICTASTECCSNSCSEDGICLGKLNDPCQFGSDCVSGVCANGGCGQAHGLGPCQLDEDCLSTVCNNHSCEGVPGDSCFSATDCANGSCIFPVSDPPATIGTCCLTTGQHCSLDAECCSGSCYDGGTCDPPAPPPPT